ncbi:YCF48-related protein [Epilithonimonas mollis]|uniref:Por secretion system C-terminal sorting domain-containing protein n=1 Tax=Epilithonimonas mollis TaxID=216903 RepID=A0A1M6Q1C2_9FLAO|nr:YCF48-related protein [Epilithonimonas mollis]SHK13931.1 Por secretion system C-terminal sorting domain-containing protein [Epilithonimonas mollis]
MKKLYFLLTFMSVFIYSQNQINWEVLSPKPTYNSGKDLHFINEMQGFFLTGKELIETKDGGTNWTVNKNFTYANSFDLLNDVGIVAQNFCQVSITKDRASTWQTQTLGAQDNLIYAKVFDNDNFVVASKNKIYSTVDGGTTWITKTFNISAANIVYFTNKNTGFVGTTNGSIFKTTDGGNSWSQKISSNTIPSDYFTMYFYNTQIGYAVQGHGNVMKTVDAGETWLKISNPSENIFAIQFLSESIGYAVGEYGVVYKTTDGGITWQTRLFQNGYIYGTSMFGLHFFNEDKGFIVGSAGRILRTDNGGFNWTQYSPFYSSVNSLEITENSIFAKVGLDIFKTSDSGGNWSKLSRPDDLQPTSVQPYARDVKFVSDNIGYIIGGKYNTESNLYKTTDGGISWTKKKNFSASGLTGFDFLNENFGIICGGQGTMTYGLYKTTDGGETWVELNGQYSFRSIKIFSEQIIYAASYSHLYKSSDGGLSWNLLFTYDNQEIADFFFLDENNGFLIGDPDVNLNRTVDGGVTWIREQIPYEWYKQIKFLNKNVGVLIDEEGQINVSYDGGRTWKYDGNHYSFNSLKIVNNKIYITGEGGRILRGNFLNVPQNVVVTKPVVEYFNDRAKLKGSVANNGVEELTDIKFEISTTQFFAQPFYIEANLSQVSSNDSKDIIGAVSGLQPNQKYYVRLTAKRNGLKINGNTENFTTTENFTLNISTPMIYGDASKVKLEGLATANGDDLLDLVFEYGLTETDFSNQVVSVPNEVLKESGQKTLTGNLVNLLPATKYYARIKGHYKGSAVYSNTISFTTNQEFSFSISNEIANEKIFLNAFVDAYYKDITELKFEYGTLDFENSVAASPDNVVALSNKQVNASINISSIDPNRPYYYRLSGKTNGRIVYSENSIFTTSPTTPILIKDSVVPIDNTSVKMKGLVYAGQKFLTSVKFEYGLTPDLGSLSPVVLNYVYGNAVQPIEFTLSGLDINKIYYYKISAMDGSEKIYSELYSFRISEMLGVQEDSFTKIKIYPNPVIDFLHFDSQDKIKEVKIFDSNGRLIKMLSLLNNSSVDVTSLTTGIYYLEAETDTKSQRFKIIKR